MEEVIKRDPIILFLDDDPNRAAIAYQRWSEDKRNRTIWMQTAAEAIDVLENYDVDEAYLDHDLGGNTFVNSEREDCGMEVIRWLEERSPSGLEKFQNTLFVVHSHNYPAGHEMCARLTKLELNCKFIPFGYTHEILQSV